MENIIEKKKQILMNIDYDFEDKKYDRDINELELRVLNKLAGFDKFLYEAKLLTENIEDYRDYLISNINEKVISYKERINQLLANRKYLQNSIEQVKAENQNNILINSANLIKENIADEHELLANYVVNNKGNKKIKSISGEIDKIEKELTSIKNKVEQLYEERKQIDKKTHQMLEDEFKQRNESHIINLKRIALNPLTSTEKALYKLMKTENGYLFITQILSEVEEINNKKNNIEKDVDLTKANLNSKTLRYLQNEYNIISKPVVLSEENIIKLRKTINSKLRETKELKSLMIKYNPNIYKKIISKKDKSYIASLLIDSFNISEEKDIPFEYKNSCILYEYINSELDEIGAKRYLSKKQKDKYNKYYNLLDEKCNFIIDTTEHYITKLFKKVIYKTYISNNGNYNDVNYLASNYSYYINEVEEFIISLQSIINYLDKLILDIESKKQVYENQIYQKKQNIYNEADIFSDGKDLDSNIDLFAVYENAYEKELYEELDEAINKELHIKNRPKYLNERKTQKFIELPIDYIL